MLNFILPGEQNREDVLSFYDEIEKSGGECIGIGNYRNYGGHIGYAIRPSERNRGLATQMLLLNGFGFIYNGDIISSLIY